MLVLTRRPGQAIRIGDSVEVYVVEVRNDQVRLSIRAPKNVAILRAEVVEQIDRENRDAAIICADLIEALASVSISPDKPPGPGEIDAVQAAEIETESLSEGGLRPDGSFIRPKVSLTTTMEESAPACLPACLPA